MLVAIYFKYSSYLKSWMKSTAVPRNRDKGPDVEKNLRLWKDGRQMELPKQSERRGPCWEEIGKTEGRQMVQDLEGAVRSQVAKSQVKIPDRSFHTNARFLPKFHQ